jgi:mannose-6-phosphate isomerase-like protein (cupin superfamily)
MTDTASAGVIAAADQTTLLEGPFGAIEALPSSATGGRLSVVIHPLAARALGSPLHTHRDEDEYSVVLMGTVGVQIGDLVATAEVGDVICKPRGIPHAFWNPSDEPARLLEIIAPGNFAGYFRDMQAVLGRGRPDPGAIGDLAERYHLTMDFASIPALAQEHGLDLGP